MKQSSIRLKTWGDREFKLVVGGDYKDLLILAKNLKMHERVINEIISEKVTQEDYGAVYWCFNQCVGIVWFPRWNIDKETISHEATHMVDYILQHVGATLEMEARAYTHDWLNFQELPEQLKKLK